MSIFDFEPLQINFPMKTGGGKVFWEILESRNGYRLQKNIVTAHYRILNDDDVRVAWGDNEGIMKAKLYSLAGNDIKPKRGDVIGVHRFGGVYDHYGIYENDNCVYEYAAPEGDFSIKEINIHITTLKKFVGDSDNCFVLVFPEKYGQPGKLPIINPLGSGAIVGGTPMGKPIAVGILAVIEELKKMKEYKLYSADETIERAKMRLGESSYNLIFNNCEHYAIWCKTGIKDSHQVNKLLRLIRGI